MPLSYSTRAVFITFIHFYPSEDLEFYSVTINSLLTYCAVISLAVLLIIIEQMKVVLLSNYIVRKLPEPEESIMEKQMA